ncbi:MAG: phosphotransferase [Acidimicrobiales bacterium]
MNGLLSVLADFAGDHGVRVDEPIVLSGTSNIVVHLAPAPVVARVPHVTASGRDRPDVSLARELAIVGHLADRGIPTTPPSRELPPGPHRIDGDRWVSFVDYVELVPVADDDAARAGESLVEVIDAMAGMTDPAGHFDRSLAEEADVSLAFLEHRIDEADRRLLIDLRGEAMTEARADAQIVHADPHRANIGRRRDGELVWFDFDDAVHDSPLVDLATLQHSWPSAGAAACRRFGIDPDGPELARFVRQRVAWGDIWMQHFGLVLGGEHADRADSVLAGHRR